MIKKILLPTAIAGCLALSQSAMAADTLKGAHVKAAEGCLNATVKNIADALKSVMVVAATETSDAVSGRSESEGADAFVIDGDGAEFIDAGTSTVCAETAANDLTYAIYSNKATGAKAMGAAVVICSSTFDSTRGTLADKAAGIHAQLNEADEKVTVTSTISSSPEGDGDCSAPAAAQ